MYLFKKFQSDKLEKIIPELAERAKIDRVRTADRVDEYWEEWGGGYPVEPSLFKDVIEILQIDDYVMEVECLKFNPKRMVQIHNDEYFSNFSIAIGIKNTDQLYMVEVKEELDLTFDYHTSTARSAKDNDMVPIPYWQLILYEERYATLPTVDFNDKVLLLTDDSFPSVVNDLDKITAQKERIHLNPLLTHTKSYHTAVNYGDEQAWCLSFRLNEKFDKQQYLNYTI